MKIIFFTLMIFIANFNMYFALTNKNTYKQSILKEI